MKKQSTKILKLEISMFEKKNYAAVRAKIINLIKMFMHTMCNQGNALSFHLIRIQV